MTLLNETEWDNVLYQFKLRLQEYDFKQNPRNNLLHIASVICSACEAVGCPSPILVGGLAVEMYTKGDYTTKDVDFITEFGTIVRKVMEQLGFTFDTGSGFFTYPAIDEIVEFPGDKLDGDETRVIRWLLDNDLFINVLSVEDAIVLRLEEFVHWWHFDLSSECAVQLISLFECNRNELAVDYLMEQAKHRGLQSALQLFLT